MIKAVQGTDVTKALISNVIGHVRKQKPNMNHVDYSITMTHPKGASNIITCEMGGKLRNVSLIRINTKNPFVKNIMASIWNESGAIRLEDKSMFTRTKTAMKRVQDFLKALQPENRSISEEGSLHLGVNGVGGMMRDIEKNEKYLSHNISTKIEGSDSMWCGEVAKKYMSEEEFLK